MGIEEQIKQHFIQQGEKRGKRIGLEIGKELGVEIGKEAALISVVKNLLASGMSHVQIAKATGLTLEQIKTYQAK